MKILRILLFGTFFLMFGIVQAQNTFFRLIHKNEIANYSNKSYCIQLRDGGYLLASNYQEGNYTGLLIVRLTAYGEIDWFKKILNSDPDVNKNLVSMMQNANGEFVFSCTYDLESHIYDEEVNYIKTDSLGNILKDINLTYSGISNWSISTGNVVLASDGNYIFTWMNYGLSGDFGIFEKINDNGSYQWGTNFGEYYMVLSSSILKNNRILFTGGSIYSTYNAKVQIASTDGSYFDQALFHNPTSSATSYNTIPSSIEFQNGFLFPVNYSDGTNNNFWLVRTNSLLDTISTKNFVGYGPVLGIDTLPSGNVIIAAIDTNAYGLRDIRFIVLDNSLNIAFTRKMGTPYGDSFFSFKKCLDGSFVISALAGDTGGCALLAFKIDTNVCVKPIANILVDSSAVFLPGEAGISFHDNSLLCLTDTTQMTWFWDFGDGTTSTLINPNHVYPAQGNYVVELIINNGCNKDTTFLSVNAVCNNLPNHFEFHDTLLTVQFSGSGLAASSWYWDFGDGTNSNLENPTHIYTNPGNYNVCLTYTNVCGLLIICDSVNVDCPPPDLNLGQDIYDCSGNTYTLNAGPSGNVYLWSTSESTNVINVNSSGTYWVQSTNICGATNKDTINVALWSHPVIDIGSDTALCLNSTYTFYNHPGSNGYLYKWYNNNVLVSSDTLYTKNFNVLGNYGIKMIASNNGCKDSSTVYVNVLTPLQCNPLLTYCTPIYSVGPSSTNYINGFSLNTINNQNSGSPTGPSYTNYYNIFQTTLITGNTYAIGITFPTSAFLYYGIWIDYNQDGVFDNTTEKIASTYAGGGTTTINYTVPTNVPAGATRLRVRCMDASTVNPCNSFTRGEAEDYKIIIAYPCPALNINSTHSDESCSGNDGSISVALSGGTMPAVYTWSNGVTGSLNDNLSPGSYTVTATDYYGCTAISNISISSATDVTSTYTNIDNQCITGNNFNFVNTGSTGSGYNYTWTFQNGNPASATTNNVNNVKWTVPGTYTITHTVSGTGSCSSYTSTTTSYISVYPQPTVSITQVNLACNGTYTGSATAVVNGGSAPFTYLWNDPLPAQTTATCVGLAAGTWTVTVNSAGECTAIASATITQPPVINISSNHTNVSCNGGSDGTATAYVSGGVTPYTYLWNDPLPAQTTQTCTGLTAGIWRVTITDGVGCTKVMSVTITQPSVITANITGTNPSCNGYSNGSANLTVSGGTSPYTYAWSNGATTEDINGISAGVYTVTITDNKLCTKTSSVTITNPTILSATISAHTNVSCNGGANGSATVTAVGGTAPYTYLWNDPAPTQTTSTCNNLTAGTWEVTVTGTGGCTSTASVTITDPAVLNTAITDQTNVLCYGDCNGTATITLTGGTIPYSINWSNGVFFNNITSSTSTITGLCAGNYSATITDANSCSETVSVTITQPAELEVSLLSQTNVTCNNNCIGSATISLAGGTIPYSISWSNGTLINNITSSTNTLPNLCEGNYNATVTDANSCSEIISVIITQLNPIIASVISQTNPLCNSMCNGTAMLSVTGGTPGYSYQWDINTGSQTTSTAVGLCAGVYCCTITDTQLCTATVCVTITDPAQIVINATPTNITCYLQDNGSINTSVTGGTPTYLYQWTNSIGTFLSNSQNISNLSADTYFLTVTDNNGCWVSTSVIINQSPPLYLDLIVTDESCFQLCDGSILANISGGQIPYTYLWSNTQNTNLINNLCPGSYFVTATDFNGCTITSNESVYGYPLLQMIVDSIIPATCGVSNGEAIIAFQGGAPGYTINWTTGGNGVHEINMPAGIATVTLTDNNGCIATQQINIPNLAGPQINSLLVSDVSCSGMNDGVAIVGYLPSNPPAPPYSITWSTIPVQTNDTASGLAGGLYFVTVGDSNGCLSTANCIVNESTILVHIISTTDDNGTGNGTASVIVAGGTSPYYIQWDDPSLQTTYTATGLSAGWYHVTITDYDGCTNFDSVEVHLWTGLETPVINFNCSLYPNPVKNEITLKISTYNAEEISVIIYNSIGDIIFIKNISLENGNNLKNFDARFITSGIYYIKLQGINKVSYLKFIKTE